MYEVEAKVGEYKLDEKVNITHNFINSKFICRFSLKDETDKIERSFQTVIESSYGHNVSTIKEPSMSRTK